MGLSCLKKLLEMIRKEHKTDKKESRAMGDWESIAAWEGWGEGQVGFDTGKKGRREREIREWLTVTPKDSRRKAKYEKQLYLLGETKMDKVPRINHLCSILYPSALTQSTVVLSIWPNFYVLLVYASIFHFLIRIRDHDARSCSLLYSPDLYQCPAMVNT